MTILTDFTEWKTWQRANVVGDDDECMDAVESQIAPYVSFYMTDPIETHPMFGKLVAKTCVAENISDIAADFASIDGRIGLMGLYSKRAMRVDGALSTKYFVCFVVVGDER